MKIEIILDNFYNCFGVDIEFLDKNHNKLCRVGKNLDSYNLPKEVNIFSEIKKNILSLLKLNYSNNINFIIYPLIMSNSLKGYFIIGPFKTDIICCCDKVPFKPTTCINYLLSTLKNIIKDNLISKPSFSTYTEDSIMYVHNNYHKDIRIDDICTYLSINKSYFCSVFKKDTNTTFTDFLNRFRIEQSKKLLLNTNFSILDIALSVGYNNQNYFTMMFKKYNNISPNEFKKNTQGL